MNGDPFVEWIILAASWLDARNDKGERYESSRILPRGIKGSRVDLRDGRGAAASVGSL